MTANPTDTIAAIATPPGRGGVGIVRVSGPLACAIARAMLGETPPARRAVVRGFRDAEGSALDTGIALFFPGPGSFTGEDVLELHGHGGPVVLDLVLQRALELGARMAEPGEFSRRAFLNDKLDLAQAEAVADLIDSSTAQAARAALRSLQGEFSHRIDALVEALIELRMYVEAAIDFPEEEIDFLSDGTVASRLADLRAQVTTVTCAAQQGRLLREGMNIVIAGRPNAGKSSLLNRLAGYDAAIVTEMPGTTRDVLRERIQIDGMPLHIIDTAGLRDGVDVVEREGVRRAWEEIARADQVLLLVDDVIGWQDADRELRDRLPAGISVTVVRNKIDLTGAPPAVETLPTGVTIRVSAHTGAGIDLLRVHLKACAGYDDATAGVFLARRRHLDALQRAAEHLDTGAAALQRRRAGELLAEELRLAQHALAEITGAFTSEDLLSRIFASFCIGK